MGAHSHDPIWIYLELQDNPLATAHQDTAKMLSHFTHEIAESRYSSDWRAPNIQDRIYLLPPNPSPHCNNHQGPQAEARAPEESHSNEVGQRAKGVDRPPAPSQSSGNRGPLGVPDIRTSRPQHLSNPAMALLTCPSSLHRIFNNSATKLKDSQVQNPQQSPDLTDCSTNY